MARCPLTETIRDIEQLGSNPPLCRQQCYELWENAIRKGDFDIEVFESFEEEKCSHPEVESSEQSVIRIGETATRDLVFHEFCTSCGGEVQATHHTFICPHEIE